MTWLWVLNTSGETFSESFEHYWDIFVSESIWTVIGAVAVVTLAETVWPAVRVPDGRFYRAVGGNRWAAAAIQGAVLGGTAAFVATNAFYLIVRRRPRLNPETFVVHGAFTALVFVVAEAVIARIWRQRLAPSPSHPRARRDKPRPDHAPGRGGGSPTRTWRGLSNSWTASGVPLGGRPLSCLLRGPEIHRGRWL